MLASSASALAGLSDEARLLLAQGAQAEEMASEILWRKKMLVDLDRQRQECTQALATLRDKKKDGVASPGGASSPAASSSPAPAAVSSPPSSLLPSALHAPVPSKSWVLSYGGSTFVRMPRASVRDMLLSDRSKLDDEIAKVRREMKDKMAELQRLAPSLQMEQGLLDFALA